MPQAIPAFGLSREARRKPCCGTHWHPPARCHLRSARPRAAIRRLEPLRARLRQAATPPGSRRHPNCAPLVRRCWDTWSWRSRAVLILGRRAQARSALRPSRPRQPTNAGRASSHPRGLVNQLIQDIGGVVALIATSFRSASAGNSTRKRSTPTAVNCAPSDSVRALPRLRPLEIRTHAIPCAGPQSGALPVQPSVRRTPVTSRSPARDNVNLSACPAGRRKAASR
jgi:hypothetical protein